MMIYSSSISDSERQQIEGYLSRKWGITLQNLNIPLTVSNCVLWLDADDSTKFTGGSSWLDKSGTNNHGINGTPGVSAMPTVTTWTNGRKAARFVAGSKNSMKTTNSVVNFVSYFMVTRVQAAVGYGFFMINNLDGQRQFVMNSSSFPLSLFWAPGGTAINLGSFIQGQPVIFCGTVTSGSGIGYINGSQVGSNTNPSTSGSSQNYFGSGNGDGGYLTIDIAEILIYTGVVSSTDRQSIENYLSAKWNIPLSRSGVTLHPFNSIRPFLRRFNPIDIPECQMWLDAADTSTITLSSGTNVSSWRDKSGNGFNGTVVNASVGSPVAPSYVTNSINGLSAITMSGTSYFTGSTNVNSTTLTAFFIGNCVFGTGGSSQQRILGLSVPGLDDYSSTLRPIPLSVISGGTQLLAYRNANMASATVVSGTNFIGCCLFDGTSNYMYKDGTLGTQVASSGTFTTSIYGVGSDAGTQFMSGTSSLGTNCLVGKIGEILLYNTALTTSQRQQVEGYLAYKWGLTSSLSATHPFKKIQPSSSLPFSPTGISDCALWFDAADVSTITGTSQVTAWRNKGSISVTATNRTGTCTSGNTLSNGLNYISCPAGTDLGFTCALTSQARTWFIVARNLTQLVASFSNAWGPINQTTAGGQDATVFYRQSESLYRGYIGAAGIAINLEGNFQSNPLNQINMYCFVNSTNTASNAMTLNGTSLSLNGSSVASNYKTTSVLYTINTTGYNTGGDYFEILFYTRAVSGQERQQIEGYLAEKWGLKSSLPSTHLYRSFPPSFLLAPSTSGSSGDYSNFLWTRFYNLTGDPSINGPGSSGWGSLIGTAGAYNPINYQDSDSRIGQSDFVGVISRGFMYSATATVVTFRTISDDGIVVIFNGSNVIQNWTYHGDTVDTSASVTLPAGYTPIELRFFEWGGGFTCELSWSIGSTGSYVSDGTSRMYHTNASKS
jgi:hypothetical protein